MTKACSAARAILVMISMSYAAIAAARVPSDHTNVPGPSAHASAGADTLPSGTVLSVELLKRLDAKKSKPNDKVEAKTASDLLLHGQIVVPRNTRIVGHVTEAKAHSKNSPGSTIKFTFDRVLFKGGRELPLPFTVQAIARPLQVSSFGAIGPDILGDASANPGRMPSMGSETPAGSAASATMNSKYPEDMHVPPVNNPDIQSPSTATPLGATSRGVVGIKGLSLNTSGPVSVLTSATGNVHLDSGSQLALRVE